MTENGNDMNEEMPVVLYTSPDGKVTVNALVKDETLWMTQTAMAELFGCTLETAGLYEVVQREDGSMTLELRKAMESTNPHEEKEKEAEEADI